MESAALATSSLGRSITDSPNLPFRALLSRLPGLRTGKSVSSLGGKIQSF